MFPGEARVPEEQGSASAPGSIDLFPWYQRWEDGQRAPRREGRVWGGARFMDAKQRREGERQAGETRRMEAGVV